MILSAYIFSLYKVKSKLRVESDFILFQIKCLPSTHSQPSRLALFCVIQYFDHKINPEHPEGHHSLR